MSKYSSKYSGKIDDDVTILRQGCISEEKSGGIEVKIAMACDHGGLRLKMY